MTTEIPTPTGDLEAELQAVAVRVAAQWDARDPADSQSAHLRGLSAGTITDWGLAGEGLKSKQPPISMSGGIPDAATQPKAGLLRAMERALTCPSW